MLSMLEDSVDVGGILAVNLIIQQVSTLHSRMKI
jgi:hypothetical protein